jgi:hypothetical protein
MDDVPVIDDMAVLAIGMRPVTAQALRRPTTSSTKRR